MVPGHFGSLQGEKRCDVTEGKWPVDRGSPSTRTKTARPAESALARAEGPQSEVKILDQRDRTFLVTPAGRGHANTKWRCTKSDDKRCTSKVTPLLAELLCCTVRYRYVSDHLYLSRLLAGRGVRSWRRVIPRHGTRSPVRRAPCRRSRTTRPSR